MLRIPTALVALRVLRLFALSKKLESHDAINESQLAQIGRLERHVAGLRVAMSAATRGTGGASDAGDASEPKQA